MPACPIKQLLKSAATGSERLNLCREFTGPVTVVAALEGLLVLAAGFFLQMATGDFLPELRRSGHLRSRLLLVMLGVLIIYAANLVIARWH